MLDKRAIVDTIERYAEVVKKEFSPKAIVLYGSHAKGSPHEDSDIDIAIIFDGFSDDWLKASARLWELTENISFDIEPVLLDSTQDKSGFVKNIYKTGQIIYQS